MSGRLSVALMSVPATKPSWTAIAIQLICEGDSCHSCVSAGTTAEPLNHSDMPSSSAIDKSARACQRRGWGSVMLDRISGFTRCTGLNLVNHENLVILYSLKIEQEDLTRLLRFNSQIRFSGYHHPITLQSTLTIDRDRSARHLEPRMPKRIHLTHHFLIRIKYRSKQTHILMHSHRSITTIFGSDQSQLPASLIFTESLLLVTRLEL